MQQMVILNTYASSVFFKGKNVNMPNDKKYNWPLNKNINRPSNTYNDCSNDTNTKGLFNKCQHFEISFSRNANKHITTCVYIAINDNYR